MAAVAVLSDPVVGGFLRLVGTGRIAEVRRVLAAAPALINAVGPHPFWGGRPQPLHVAIEKGDRLMIAALLAAGADVNGTNHGYGSWSPLLIAIERRRQAVVRQLRARGARVGLVEALALGDDRLVGRLLAASGGVLPDPPSGGSLLKFARTWRAIDRLLALGVASDSADQFGSRPIEALSRLGDQGRPLVRRLIARGVVPPLAVFARLGDRTGLRRWAGRGRASLEDPTVLMAAVEFRHRALAKWILDQGADPSGRAGGSAQTPLHTAAWNGDLATVKMLVSAGADPTLTDHEHGATPRGWAETAVEVTGNYRCRGVATWLARLEPGS